MPNPDNYLVRQATTHDLAGITTLLQENAAGNGGALNGDFPAEKVAGMLNHPGAIVAVAQCAAGIAGVLFSTSSFRQGPEVVNAMLRAWPPGKQCWIYGPACISTQDRGQGLLLRLYDELRSHYGNKAPVLFIQADNRRSIQAHERLGMTRVAQFYINSVHFLVYSH
ncbi:GNAT family N-acetyltransferase [uncultured Pantoea sp.]|uniref:GNAT family N-acetyltransferase n=1 Tax=Pantoea ananas TaxID=553 RepID=UPI00258EB2E7|nr:GNAT family N-acetyltransferase [uncultured Pantoea sp.]